MEVQVCPLPDYGSQSNTLKCRYCRKLYKQGLRLRKHKEHNHRDPLYSSDFKDEAHSFRGIFTEKLFQGLDEAH